MRIKKQRIAEFVNLLVSQYKVYLLVVFETLYHFRDQAVLGFTVVLPELPRILALQTCS